MACAATAESEPAGEARDVKRETTGRRSPRVVCFLTSGGEGHAPRRAICARVSPSRHNAHRAPR